MMEIKASVKNLRSTPRKARLIADFVRGKNVNKAIAELTFLNKKAAEAFIKLLKSGTANAKNNHSIKNNNLYIKSIEVREGMKMKRHRAGSNGRALPFRRRLSNISIVLTSNNSK